MPQIPKFKNDEEATIWFDAILIKFAATVHLARD